MQAEKLKGNQLTEEEKSDGIIEDRRNIVEKNLKICYFRLFLGNTDGGLNRNVESVPVLELIALRD